MWFGVYGLEGMCMSPKVNEPGYEGMDASMGAKSFSLLLMYTELTLQLD